MNAALLEPALLLQWFGALCSTAAGAAILNRNRLPHAPQIGRFLLALAADLAGTTWILMRGENGADPAWGSFVPLLHLTLLTALLALASAVTEQRRATQVATRASEFLLVGVPLGALAVASLQSGIAGQAVFQSFSTTVEPLTQWARLNALPITGLLVVVVCAGLLLREAARTDGKRRRLALTFVVGLLMVGVVALLERVLNADREPASLLRIVLALAGCAAAVLVFRGAPPRSEATIRTVVFEHLHDGILVLDDRDVVLEINPTACDILGCTNAMAKGQRLDQVWPASTTLLRSMAEGADALDCAFTVADVALTYRLTLFPSAGVDGPEKTLVLRNTTDPESLEHALRQRARDLSRTNQLITALASVTARLSSNVEPRLIWEALGAELRRIGLNCAIVSIDPLAEAATVRYVSFAPELIKMVTLVTRLQVSDLVVPRRNWPGERILHTTGPVWSTDPLTYLRRMFPHLPDRVADQALRMLGIGAIGQICLLPLVVEDKLIGTVPIWGADISPADNAVLAVFAGQVAGILHSADARALETQRAAELTRSNAMILALSKVASRLDTTSKFAEVVETLGQELQRMNVDCLVGTVDAAKQNMRIRHISIKPDLIRWAERVTGHSLSDIEVPRHLWPSDRVVTDRIPYWDTNGIGGAMRMFPALLDGVQRNVMQMAGLNLDDPVCYLPLAHDEDVVGILAVWGPSLRSADVPALSVFSTQLATALRNTELFEQEARRARDLGLLLKASEATAASWELDKVLSILATQLIEISGFEACRISEWDRPSNQVQARLHRARIAWDADDPRASLSPADAPPLERIAAGATRIEGDPDAPDGERLVVWLALRAGDASAGLVELGRRRGRGAFTSEGLCACETLVAEAAAWLQTPLAASPGERLQALQDALLLASDAESCTLVQWEPAAGSLRRVASTIDVAWPQGAGPSHTSEHEDAWALAIDRGEASVLVRPERTVVQALTTRCDLEPVSPAALVVFPLHNGADRIGLIELHNYTNARTVTPAQVAFLRMVADKAGLSIHNARLFAETQKRLSEKEVLLKEVHHRVKNNLQVISSLLNLQASQIADARVKSALRESQNRVRSMALIHEKLYQSANLAEVDFAAYLRNLVSFLSQSYRERANSVDIVVRAAALQLDLETAIPCGLIVNELVSNALKHAFPDGRAGVITVSLEPIAEGQMCLVVADDGVGIPADAGRADGTSLGLSLVRTLVDQIGGSLTITSEVGAAFRICFSPSAARARS